MGCSAAEVEQWDVGKQWSETLWLGVSRGNNLFSQFACFLLSICSYTVRKYQGWVVYKEKIMYLGSFVAPECKQHDVGSSETLLAAQCPSGASQWDVWGRGQMTSLDEKSSRQWLERGQACFFYGYFLMSIKSVSQKNHLCPKDSVCDLHVLLPKCPPPRVMAPRIKTPAYNKPLPHGE